MRLSPAQVNPSQQLGVVRPGRTRCIAKIVLVAVAATVAGCGAPILPDEAFRYAIPANAQLVNEVTGDGSSLIEDGERVVLRTFVPTPPAEAEDVLAALVEDGERDGWVFTEHTATRAVATKEIDGGPWMVSLAIRDGMIQQLFAGR
jgi:hypothetical protein